MAFYIVFLGFIYVMGGSHQCFPEPTVFRFKVFFILFVRQQRFTDKTVNWLNLLYTFSGPSNSLNKKNEKILTWHGPVSENTGSPGSVFLSCTGFSNIEKFWSGNLPQNGNKNQWNVPCGDLLLFLICTWSFGKNSLFCVHIKYNKNSPRGKFHPFLFPFSSKFPDLNFAP